jgi:hypothetical protein
MPRASFEFSLGEHTVRIKQLAPDDALSVCDVLLNRVSEPVLNALMQAVPAMLGGKTDAIALEGALATLLDSKVAISWPADGASSGFARIRKLYTDSAELRLTVNGSTVWQALRDCTDVVFGGKPGLRYRFDAQCTRCNCASFFEDIARGGWELRPATE